jgi:hypothetical protein
MAESEDTLSNNIRVLRAALLTLSGTRQTGSQLRAIFDVVCPGFDLRAAAGVPVGSGALTKLIQTHFADLLHPIGKNGGDNVFQVGTPQLDSVKADAAHPTNFWTLFANPGLGWELVFDKISKSLSVVAKGSQLQAHQNRITPISAEDFRAIAERFIDDVPTEARDELQKVLAGKSFLYQNWISTLKGIDPSQYHRWGLFRVKAITDLFRNRLLSTDVPDEQVETAYQALVAHQKTAYEERIQVMRGGIERRDGPSTQSAHHLLISAASAVVSDARSIAINALNYMTIDEIRQLKVPLGAVIDSILLSRR